MDVLEKKKTEIEQEVEKLRRIKNEREERLSTLNKEIKDKIRLHNDLIASVASLKGNFKSSLPKFSNLKALVKQYKKDQIEVNEVDYQRQINYITQNINKLKFTPKITIFNDFDYIKSQNTEMFAILNAKKNEFFETQKILLKNRILSEVKRCSEDPSLIGDLIFNINFIVKYEIYFKETAFFNYLAKLIETGFEYHFMTDKDTNRLDKPEWFFDFLVTKCKESADVFYIYNECCSKAGLKSKSLQDLISFTQKLVLQKLTDVCNCESPQKRNLILNFAINFRNYSEKVKRELGHEVDISPVSHYLTQIQLKYVDDSLSTIHEMNYLQWFGEYKVLCRECISYICNFHDIDPEFNLKIVIKPIIDHSRVFLENLRFINREEIKVAAYVFSEFEELKDWLISEESDVFLSSISGVEDIATSSVARIVKFNGEIFKLIKNLAVRDVQNSVKKISSFKYTKEEAKRTFIVEINRIIEDYKICIYSDIINDLIIEEVDKFIYDEILLKTVFTSDEYLEFRNFFRALKKVLKDYKWKSNDLCECIDAIFEDRKLATPLYKSLKAMYENN